MIVIISALIPASRSAGGILLAYTISRPLPSRFASYTVASIAAGEVCSHMWYEARRRRRAPIGDVGGKIWVYQLHAHTPPTRRVGSAYLATANNVVAVHACVPAELAGHRWRYMKLQSYIRSKGSITHTCCENKVNTDDQLHLEVPLRSKKYKTS